MVARSLVTTANNQIWPKNKPIVFIGEWCKRHSEKYIWEQIDSKVSPYHWDNRDKLAIDSNFLDEIYEECLGALSTELNSFHNINYPTRFWRILLGPWLGIFIQILFDRYEMIKTTLESYEIDSCNVYEFKLEKIVPNDMSHFSQILVSDTWNEAIYAKLIELIPNDLDVKILSDKTKHFSSSYSLPFSHKIKFQLKSIFNIIQRPITKNDKIFVYNSGFSKWTDLQIQLKFMQTPKIWVSPQLPKFKLNHKKRNWNLQLNRSSEFTNIIQSLIPLCIPSSYLEGFQSLLKIQNKLPWPNNPSVIFTSNAYFTDDVFKVWTALKTNKNSSLLIGQHGGNFGMTPRAFLEKHQINISNAFLSWGWSNRKDEKVIPVGNLVTGKKFTNYDPIGPALMVEYALPRYSYQIYSVPIASQWLDYFNQQSEFINNLSSGIKDKVQLRLYKDDFGWDQYSRWIEIFPSIKFNDKTQSMKEAASRSRIFIATYNATTYLESLSWNMPTIIFWKTEHWELNADAKEYFELLESVGIFHKTPESAANKLNSIWDDIESWWWSDKVQCVVKTFCNKYSSISNDSTHKIEAIFKNYL